MATIKSIEEKAKAYDEAIEIARAKYAMKDQPIHQDLVDIFPELKESEDERIRKELIGYFTGWSDKRLFRGFKAEQMLAWLEKQGQTFTKKDVDDAYLKGVCDAKQALEKQGKNNMGISEATKQKLEGSLNKALEKETPESWNEFLEKQGEQKPTDKVEPKFKVGDWVVYCNDDVDLITGIEENGYCINNSGYIPFICASDVRLWTIEDAKDGDVLVSESNCGLGTWYCIFKSLDGDESMTVHCYLSRDGRFETKKELCFDKDPYSTKPATKEQRDLLFQKMHEAGYEWDAEKKELKEIEQNPAWSEEDEYCRHQLIVFCENCMQPDSGAIRCANWLKSLKDRVQPQQKWSEEDKIMKGKTINYINAARMYVDVERVPSQWADECVNWLKSLRPQNTWKPSKWQMFALNTAIKMEDGDILKSLYNDLKKLREEQL